jgi:hypothetical protein
MAASGYTPIQLYYSTTAGHIPTAGNLLPGELALNVTDGKLYFNQGGTVTLLTQAGTSSGTVTNVAASGGTTGLTFTGSPITTAGTLTLGGVLGTANGGTGQSSYTNGQILIGSSTSGNLVPATITAGSNITITNGPGTITIASSGGGGNGSVNSVTATYPITSTGGANPIIGIANSAGGVTQTTGTGFLVFNTNPTFNTPNLGTPSAVTLTNATGLPLTSGVTGTLPVGNGGTGVTTATGTGSVVLNTSPTLVTPYLGTPQSVNLINATGLLLTSGVSGTLQPANGGTGTNSSTGSGAVVLNNAPTIYNANLQTPSSINIVNATGLTQSQVTTALGYTPVSTNANNTFGSSYTQTFNGTTNIAGITNGSSAASGYVGEVITNSASNVSLTSGVTATICTVSLGAGVWLINSVASANQGSGSSALAVAFITDLNTTGSIGNSAGFFQSGAGITAISLPYTLYLNVSSTTTVYLSVDCAFSGGTFVGLGYITAIRIR